MTIKLGIIGASGKMGQRICFCALNDADLSISWTLASKSSINTVTITPTNVIIDFSTAEALIANLELAISKNCPIVIGTTGFGSKEQLALKKASYLIPVFFAPNFSLGMAATIYVTEKLSSLLTNFTSHIKEIHHIHKKDNPSGSAIAIQEALKKGNKTHLQEIESIREGEVIGDHHISFSSENEKITLCHKALSRDVFAKGALEAAKFLTGKPPGLYTMQDLLKTFL